MPNLTGNPNPPPESSWNYRVIEFVSADETFRAIHEVYYRHGVPVSYTVNAASIGWDKEEGDETALRALDRMREAVSKPVLTDKDFRSADIENDDRG